MNSTILASTFFLTFLLSIGLFFFIRASVKDRTEQITFVTDLDQDSLLSQLQQYFADRAYRVQSVEAETNSVTFEGVVRPSLFLAIFLSVLAGVGLLCLSLVLAIASTSFQGLWLGLVGLAPLAGVFYWQKAGRVERVSLQLASVEGDSFRMQSAITVTGHRDELAQLQTVIPLKVLEAKSV